MAELKTKANSSDVNTFLNAVDDEQKRADSFALCALMEEVTGDTGKMWGDSIVGFGQYHYRYASGREGEWMLTGFSPRKANLTLYIMAGFDQYDELMAKLGKYKTGKSCLYIKRLSDINTDVLRELVQKSVDHMRATDP